MAEIRASALKKKRGRQPKKNPLTEEEKKERSRKYAKAAYERKKAGKSKKAAEADAGSWQIVEVREGADYTAATDMVLRDSDRSSSETDSDVST